MDFETASGAGGGAGRVVFEPPAVGKGRGGARHDEVDRCEGCDAESFKGVCEQGFGQC